MRRQKSSLFANSARYRLTLRVLESWWKTHQRKRPVTVWCKASDTVAGSLADTSKIYFFKLRRATSHGVQVPAETWAVQARLPPAQHLWGSEVSSGRQDQAIVIRSQSTRREKRFHPRSVRMLAELRWPGPGSRQAVPKARICAARQSITARTSAPDSEQLPVRGAMPDYSCRVRLQALRPPRLTWSVLLLDGGPELRLRQLGLQTLDLLLLRRFSCCRSSLDEVR